MISILEHHSRCPTTHRTKCLVKLTLNRILFVTLFVIILSATVVQAGSVSGGPCLGCRLFNHQHLKDVQDNKKDEICHYPCQCQEELTCQNGVSVVRDGCGCCYMCARQIGDLCSFRDHCDTAKGIFCDSWDQNSTGVCKGRDRKPCLVDGVTYKDGEKFQPACSQLCTCQNGFYGCVDTCPQELQKPSELTCHEPKLIQVRNKCCKEWTCQKMEAVGSSANNGLKSDNLIQHHISTPPTMQESTSLATSSYQSCYKQTTDWTPCSVTCDVGVSIRIVVDQISCNNYQELQLCYIRPCGQHNLEDSVRKKCTPTTRRNKRHNVQYQDCRSIKDYRLKFCSTCKRNQCCYPRRTRIRPMEFQCSDGKRETYNYMWIKNCRCEKTCDRKPGYSRWRGHNNGRAVKMKRRHGRRRHQYDG